MTFNVKEMLQLVLRMPGGLLDTARHYYDTAKEATVVLNQLRVPGARASLRRYIAVMIGLMPINLYLVNYFGGLAVAHAAIDLAHVNWAKAVTSAQLAMFFCAPILIGMSSAALLKRRFETTVQFLVATVYISFGSVLSLADAKLGGAGNGGVTFLMMLILLSVLTLSPPYLAIPFFTGSILVGTSYAVYSLEAAGAALHPGVIVDMLIAVPVTCLISLLVWHQYGKRKLLGIELADSRVLLEKQHDQLISLAEFDELTGMYNSKKFWQIANRDFTKASRLVASTSGSASSLMVIDIDKLASINQKLGHAVGDQIIKKIAHIVVKDLRSTDVFGKALGGKFIVFLPHTKLIGGLLVASKLCADVRLAPIQVAMDSDATTIREIPVTVSIGLAAGQGAQGESYTLSALHRRADKALVEAKRRGRDNVAHLVLPDDPLVAKSAVIVSDV